MVKASVSFAVFRKFPTAVQFPAVGHETLVKVAFGTAFCTLFANVARCAFAQDPFDMDTTKASLLPPIFSSLPTAVQSSEVVQTTLKSVASIGTLMTLVSNVRGRPLAHVPFVEVIVNALK